MQLRFFKLGTVLTYAFKIMTYCFLGLEISHYSTLFSNTKYSDIVWITDNKKGLSTYNGIPLKMESLFLLVYRRVLCFESEGQI